MTTSSHSRSKSYGRHSVRRSHSRSGSFPTRHKRHRHGRSPPYNNHRNQKATKNSKLFITNIDSKFNPQDIKKSLEQQFQYFGPIKETVVKTKKGSQNSFAFIQFQEVQHAAKALEQMMGKIFKGKQLKVEYGKGERKFDEIEQRCRICHRTGHYAKDCRDRYKQKYFDERHQHRHRKYSRSSSSSDRRDRRRRSKSRDRRDYEKGHDYYRRRDSRDHYYRSSRSKSPYRKDRYPHRRY